MWILAKKVEEEKVAQPAQEEQDEMLPLDNQTGSALIVTVMEANFDEEAEI